MIPYDFYFQKFVNIISQLLPDVPQTRFLNIAIIIFIISLLSLY